MDDKELYNKFCEYIRQYETQEDAAKALDVSPAYVSMLMTGQKPITKWIAEKIGFVQVVTWQERE